MVLPVALLGPEPPRPDDEDAVGRHAFSREADQPVADACPCIVRDVKLVEAVIG